MSLFGRDNTYRFNADAIGQQAAQRAAAAANAQAEAAAAAAAQAAAARAAADAARATSAANAATSASNAASRSTTQVFNRPSGFGGFLQFNTGGDFNSSGNLLWDNNQQRLNIFGDHFVSGNITGNVISNAATVTTLTATIGAFSNVSATTANIDTINVGNVINATKFLGDGSSLTGIVSVASPAFTGAPTAPTAANGTANTQIATTQFVNNRILNINSIPNPLAITGNVTASGFVTAGFLTSTGNVTGGNLRTGGVVTATGNVIGSNVLTSGVVSATGNLTGANVLASGAVSATGNITGAVLVGTAVTVTGNVTSANLLASTNLLAANITANTSMVVGGSLRGPLLTKTGASTGTAGQICWDANYIYVCTATNVWKRASLSSF